MKPKKEYPAYMCPECGKEGGVIDSRKTPLGLRRRRYCFGKKKHRWSTFEVLFQDKGAFKREILDGIIKALRDLRKQA